MLKSVCNSQLWNPYEQAKKVRKNNHLHVFCWGEKASQWFAFLGDNVTQVQLQKGKKKKACWLLILHFISMCPNFVWLIALNCLIFEKQQQIKRKLSAGEKICFREEEEQKGSEDIINLASYMNTLYKSFF